MGLRGEVNMDIEKIERMFKGFETIKIRVFLKEYGIYLPPIPFVYITEEKKGFMFVHIYPQGVPIKVLITIDKEKGEVTVDWIECRNDNE